MEAENEKEQVETRTAADEEDLAREALLRGDPLTAAQHLKPGLRVRTPGSCRAPAAAHRDERPQGLSTVLGGGSGTFTNLEVAPESGLVLTVTSDGEAQVWDPQKSAPVLVFGKSGNVYNQVHQASFTPDGKRVLFSNDAENFLEEIATGKKVLALYPAKASDLRP